MVGQPVSLRTGTQRADNDVVQRRRVLQRHQVAVVRRHAEAELCGGALAIGQQALTLGGVGPGLGDDTGAIAGDPFLLGQVISLVDGRGGFHVAGLHYGLDGVDALLDGRGARGGSAVVIYIFNPSEVSYDAV